MTAARLTMRAGTRARAHGTQPQSLPSPQPPLPMAAARLTRCGGMMVSHVHSVSSESKVVSRLLLWIAGIQSEDARRSRN